MASLDHPIVIPIFEAGDAAGVSAVAGSILKSAWPVELLAPTQSPPAPAITVGALVDQTLVTEIVADVKHQPGASHARNSVWDHFR